MEKMFKKSEELFIRQEIKKVLSKVSSLKEPGTSLLHCSIGDLNFNIAPQQIAVNTYIGRDTAVGIVFNFGTSIFWVNKRGLMVTQTPGKMQYRNMQESFRWVKVKRESLFKGDIAYRSESLNSDLRTQENMCCIVDDTGYYTIQYTIQGFNQRVIIYENFTYSHWWKLVANKTSKINDLVKQITDKIK